MVEWNEAEWRRLFKAMRLRRAPGQEKGLSAKCAAYISPSWVGTIMERPAIHYAGLYPSRDWEQLGYTKEDRIPCLLYLLQTGWQEVVTCGRGDRYPLLYALLHRAKWKLSGDDIDALIQVGCEYDTQTYVGRNYPLDGKAMHVAASFQSPFTMDQLNAFLKHGCDPKERAGNLDVLEWMIMARARHWVDFISLSVVRKLISLGCNMKYDSGRHVFENRDATKNYEYGEELSWLKGVLTNPNVAAMTYINGKPDHGFIRDDQDRQGHMQR